MMRRFFCSFFLAACWCAPAAAADTTAAAAPLPMTLTWPDRRPIGRIFIGDRPPTPRNPSGYQGTDVDVTTPEGRERFRRDLLAIADRLVAAFREMDAQGMIVWDIEGQEFRGCVYVGDPRKLAAMAPWMDEVADDFFRRFKEAGLRTGVCLRPMSLFRIPEEHLRKHGRGPAQHWGYMLYREAGLPITKPEIGHWVEAQKDAERDPIAELSDRVQYAQRRWGATLFYIDTNSFARSDGGREKHTLLTAEQMQRLARLHPDCLFIPEHETPDYYASTAPYNHPGVDPTAATPAAVRTRYPGSFLCEVIPERQDFVRWDEYVNGVQEGDVLFCDGVNRTVQRMVREAALRREPDIGNGDLNSPDAARRLAAARGITTTPSKEEATRLLAIAQDDPEWCVRRAALRPLALAALPEADAFLVSRLGDHDLGGHAAVALAARGAEAVALVKPVLEDQADERRDARYDAGFTLARVDDPCTIEPLGRLLADKYSKNRGFAFLILNSQAIRHPSDAVYDAIAAAIESPLNAAFAAAGEQLLKTLASRGFKGTAARSPQSTSPADLFDAWWEWVQQGADPARSPAAVRPLLTDGLLDVARREAAILRERIATPGDLPALLELAQDKTAAARYHAVVAIEAGHDRRAVEPLAAMLAGESDAVVQRRIIEALHRFGIDDVSRNALVAAPRPIPPLLKPFVDAALAAQPSRK